MPSNTPSHLHKRPLNTPSLMSRYFSTKSTSIPNKKQPLSTTTPSLSKRTHAPTRHALLRASSPSDPDTTTAPSAGTTTFGEDAAAFDLSQQSVQSWGLFVGLLTGVMALLYAVWIAPGLGIGDEFVHALESFVGSGNGTSSESTMLLILFVFAIAHSGLAFLRPYGEKLIGPRAYRVIFAFVSLPLATAAVVYFINHRYDGSALWNIRY